MKSKSILALVALLVLVLFATGCGPSKYRHIHTGKIAGTDAPEFAAIYDRCEAQALENCPDCRRAESMTPRGGETVSCPGTEPSGPDYQALCQECLNREISKCLRAAGWVPSR